ncbi:MAG: hypothetical protein JWN98_2364, partial [Abditibacteriota bacterium]|nr:hypothetical protein [Abditibacteriota bacterium]
LPASAANAEVVLEKTLWMPYGRNTTVVRYRLLSGPEIVLHARAFLSGRDYHHTHRFNPDFHPTIERREPDSPCFTMQPYPGLPAFSFAFDGEFHAAGAWYYAFEHAIEQERGLDFQEDAYCPGAFVWQLAPGQEATLAVGLELDDLPALRATRESEIARRAQLSVPFADFTASDANAAGRLARAADQFIVQRKDGLHTVLAGYHWFSDWGRDTMIALPGLCLSTQRFAEARSILLSFAQAASEGMIPNRFPDAGEIPDYNTIDATLWFFHAVAQYLERSGDGETVDKVLYPVLRECIQWHIKGTRFGIMADPEDGLLRGGDDRTQLTWMDAKVGDVCFTPRAGKPVEIQALWFNALKTTMVLADRVGDRATKVLCGEWSRRAKANFATQFWNEAGYCFDWVDGEERNAQIRPNQIFVVSLPHRLLSREQEARIVATVERELLTPFGLRSLSPNDAQYRGIYIGDQWQRDSGYHQGTVWGWLLGPFLSAYLRVNRSSARSKIQVRQWMKPMLGHLDQAGIGSISEIFDGDEPHTPRGCIAQAWSVAETLRVLGDELN